ncbi:hypothetical protein C5167_036070 [Papaver somniferum]|nr:hypothetical protein C5167_036070 [Papaver somniferum]
MRAKDVNQAEALAVIQATRWITNKKLSRIIIKGDNKIIMEVLKSGQMEGVKQEDKPLLSECLSMINEMSDVQVQYLEEVIKLQMHW